MVKKPLTKFQIVSYFAGKFELPKKAASAIIDGGSVGPLGDPEDRLLYPSTNRETGFGQEESSYARNPATGEPLRIPAKTEVKMRVAKAGKEAIVPKRN